MELTLQAQGNAIFASDSGVVVFSGWVIRIWLPGRVGPWKWLAVSLCPPGAVGVMRASVAQGTVIEWERQAIQPVRTCILSCVMTRMEKSTRGIF
jgi:hypothetical protein